MVYFLEISIELPIILTGIASAFLHKKFANKIEIPLKEKVLKRLCPVLYSKLEYSHDGKYSFSEMRDLVEKRFLNSYDSIKIVEDSIFFPMQKDGKNFYVHGFELETTQTRGSGKNRRTVTTNHDYLIKAKFPQARMPMNADLFIKTDSHDNSNSSSGGFFANWFIILIAFFAFSPLIFIGIFAVQNGQGIDFMNIITVVIAIVLVVILVPFLKKLFSRPKQARVKLENIEFEKFFDVYCDDQVTSRMIITPAFMDRLVQFAQKTGNQYEFLFRSNIMYVKRKINGSYLEAGTSKDMTKNLDGYVKFYTDMREIMQFVYDMNLMYLSKTDVNFVGENYEVRHSPIMGSTSGEAIDSGSATKTAIIGAAGGLLGGLL